MPVDKVLITNARRLRAKYGRTGTESVERALKRLILADERRGFSSQLVYLDDRTHMRDLGLRPVRKYADRRQNKRAIDAIYRALKPAYIVLVGAQDVVPHQSLKNPVGGAGGDEDAFVPSDLPYACDAPYGRSPEDFLGPTRVVSRLPDLLGADDPRYLTGLISKAARWASASAAGYKSGFAVSADVWKGSTRQSARKLFGTSRVQLSPPRGPAWEQTLLARKVHFINCHGARVDPHFYGEDDDENFPVAVASNRLRGVKTGAIVAAECCYGAQLYDPEEYETDMGICNAYLKRGACGFFGSTTIAYGPATGNGAADLICQYFVRNVQKGASLGRAALEARQEFVRKNAPLDPVDLKTLLQFYLLGEASIHPVKTNASSKKKTKKKRATRRKARAKVAKVVSAFEAFQQKRRARRSRLDRTGDLLGKVTPSSQSTRIHRKLGALQKMLDELAAKHSMSGTLRTFAMRQVLPSDLPAKGGAKAKAMKAKAAKAAKEAFHVMVEKGTPKRPTDAPRMPWKRILVVRETDGDVADVKVYVPR